MMRDKRLFIAQIMLTGAYVYLVGAAFWLLFWSD